MREYLPVLILGAIIGTFTVAFLIVYALEKDKKAAMGFERHMADGEIIRRLLHYGRPHAGKFVLVLFIMLFSIGYDLISPLIIGHIVDTVQEDFEIAYLLGIVVG